MSNNFQRMIALATETFAVHNDPQQLNVDEEELELLAKLHPSTLSAHIDGDGPVIWVLLIPTTNDLMHAFMGGQLGETELLNNTPVGIQYDALYLCSALTLPEFRKQGLTKNLCLKAVAQICNDHPIKTLFVWNFSLEGKHLAETVAGCVHLPILERSR